MTLVDFLWYWILPIIAIVYVLGYSYLFEPLRQSKKLPEMIRALFDCPMCLGAWTGLLVGAMNWAPVKWPAWLQYPALGLLSAIGIQYIIELAARRKRDVREEIDSKNTHKSSNGITRDGSNA